MVIFFIYKKDWGVFWMSHKIVQAILGNITFSLGHQLKIHIPIKQIYLYILDKSFTNLLKFSNFNSRDNCPLGFKIDISTINQSKLSK